jgi:hypothetical protein
MENFWVNLFGMIVVAGIMLVCLLIFGCAPVPVLPEGMVLVPKDDLRIVVENYNLLVKDRKELLELLEWKDKMWF